MALGDENGPDAIHLIIVRRALDAQEEGSPKGGSARETNHCEEKEEQSLESERIDAYANHINSDFYKQRPCQGVPRGGIGPCPKTGFLPPFSWPRGRAPSLASRRAGSDDPAGSCVLPQCALSRDQQTVIPPTKRTDLGRPKARPSGRPSRRRIQNAQNRVTRPALEFNDLTTPPS